MDNRIISDENSHEENAHDDELIKKNKPDESCLVAVSTTDDIVVNAHFGRASHFQVVRMNMNEFSYEVVESRDVKPVCDSGNHSDEALALRIEEFKDCKYFLVSRVGPVARNEIEKNGIEIFEIPGVIKESLHDIYTHLQIQKLFFE